MIKKMVILFLGIMALYVSSAFAEDLEVTLSCPSYVNAGSALKVPKVKVYNDGDSSVTLNRYAAGIVGNYNNILSTGRVYGPYAKKMTTSVTIPAGGTVTLSSVPILSPVSTDLKGYMALVVVNFINNSGQSLGGNTCLVNVQ